MGPTLFRLIPDYTNKSSDFSMIDGRGTHLKPPNCSIYILCVQVDRVNQLVLVSTQKMRLSYFSSSERLLDEASTVRISSNSIKYVILSFD